MASDSSEAELAEAFRSEDPEDAKEFLQFCDTANDKQRSSQRQSSVMVRSDSCMCHLSQACIVGAGILQNTSEMSDEAFEFQWVARIVWTLPKRILSHKS